MNLQEGLYVRTTNGRIAKIESIIGNYIFLDINHNIHDKQKIKSVSNDLIDLIEPGDYVNGERVIALRKDIPERYIHMNSKDNFIFVEYDLANNWYYGIDTDKIKTVVTKEQFESMKYVVGGE